MELSDQIIKDIANNLECGLICFFNPQTMKVIALPSLDMGDIDEDLWQEDLEEIDRNRQQYLELEPMPAKDGFDMMLDFVEEVKDSYWREQLEQALSRKKPFSQFKNVVNSNEPIRQQWFKFKAEQYQTWVKNYIKDNLI